MGFGRPEVSKVDMVQQLFFLATQHQKYLILKYAVKHVTFAWVSLVVFFSLITFAFLQISTKKTEVMVLSRQKEECAVNVNGTPLDQVEKFKYLGVEFSNDARLDCEIDRRIGSASAILRSLYRSVVTKKEVS